jgi:hypothetical protein
LWKEGPDRKFYATEEGLRRAEEKWLKKNTYHKLPQDEIINKEKQSSLINLNEAQPSTILSPNILKTLTKIPADQLSALADFLASLPYPITSSPKQK